MRVFVFFVALFSICGFAASQTPEDFDFGGELSNLDFGKIIGGPLLAVIEAQSQASRMTVDFVNTLGFEVVGGRKRVFMTDFVYESINNGTLRNFTMTLPFLTMLPIPYIIIREITIDFNVKLDSVQRTETSSLTETSTSASGSFGLFGFGLKFSVTMTSKQETKTTGEVKKQYNLGVHVEASQGPMPAGTQRILDLFEDIIRDTIPTN